VTHCTQQRYASQAADTAHAQTGHCRPNPRRATVSRLPDDTDRVENAATPTPPIFRATEPGTFPNTSTGTSLTSPAATVRALADIHSPQPPGCRKEDPSYKYGPFWGPQICTLQ
jgi:hypothetical protein